MALCSSTPPRLPGLRPSAFEKRHCAVGYVSTELNALTVAGAAGGDARDVQPWLDWEVACLRPACSEGTADAVSAACQQLIASIGDKKVLVGCSPTLADVSSGMYAG